MAEPGLRSHLRDRGVPTVAMVTYAVAALAWVVLGGRMIPMPGSGMVMDLTAPGVPESMGTSNGVVGVLTYLVMWGAMMVAMMYPSSAGIFQWYADVRKRRHGRGVTAGVVAFVATYTLVWVLVGLLPLVVDAFVPIASLHATWGALYYGVAFLVVAAFQLSPFKRHCLHHCRSPSAYLLDRHHPRVPGAARLGWEFGRLDVGSCGVLMGLMVVVGSMDVRWMAVITGVLLLERLTNRGVFWARGVGVLAGVGGLVLVGSWLL